MSNSASNIARNPAQYADCPEVFTYAWLELKAARGEIMRPENLPGSMHSIRPNNSIIATVREIAARKGYKLAPPRVLVGGQH